MNRRTFFIALTFFVTIVACAIPGLSPAAVPTPAPTVDTGILSTMVAETVSAAIVLTEQAFPTPTLVPASASTTSPTIPPTAEINPSGSTLTVQEDGTTLFVDELAGYEVIVPAGWLAVRIDQPEYQDALTVAPDIQRPLSSVQNNDPNTFRLYALDIPDWYLGAVIWTNMNFIWDEQGDALLKNDDGLAAGVAQLTENPPEPEILSTSFSSTSNGVPLNVIEAKSTVKNSSGTDMVVFQKQAAFNAKTGTVAITVTTVEELKDSVFSAFDAMMETIKIIPG